MNAVRTRTKSRYWFQQTQLAISGGPELSCFNCPRLPGTSEVIAENAGLLRSPQRRDEIRENLNTERDFSGLCQTGNMTLTFLVAALSSVECMQFWTAHDTPLYNRFKGILQLSTANPVSSLQFSNLTWLFSARHGYSISFQSQPAPISTISSTKLSTATGQPGAASSWPDLDRAEVTVRVGPGSAILWFAGTDLLQ